MKKEEKIENRYVKMSTAIGIALMCLVIGFGTGIFFKKLTGTDRKVQKRTVQQPVTQTPPPQMELFKQVLSLHLKVMEDSKDAEAWASLGHTYFDMNEFSNAIQAYQKHLELNPDNADVWADLGVMYRRSGKPEEAINAFDKAMDVDPNHRQSRFNKGVVFLHDLKNPAEALKAWEELLKINPETKVPTGHSLKDLVEQLRKQVHGGNREKEVPKPAKTEPKKKMKSEA